MTKPTLDIFSGSKGLGTIFSEQNSINVKFWDFNIPFTDTEGRVSGNWGGKNRIIMVQGAHNGTGFDGATQEEKLSDFIYEMEVWVNASVQTKQIYTDSFETAYFVDAVDWQWTRSFSDPNRILYSLIMKQK